MTQLDELQAYVNFEMVRRGVMLPSLLVGGYDGDPNDVAAPDILKDSPVGTRYVQATGPKEWVKLEPGSTTWTEVEANVAETRTLYVGKHGNDTGNDGLNVGYPFLTIGAAIAAATALSPTESSPVTIRIHDAGIYKEVFDLPDWTHLIGPAASVVWDSGTPSGSDIVQAGEGCFVWLARVETAVSNTYAVSKTFGSLGTTIFHVAKIISTHCCVASRAVGGRLYVVSDEWRANLRGFNGINGAEVYLDVGKIVLISDNAAGIFTSSAVKLSGSIGSIQEEGALTGTYGIRCNTGEGEEITLVVGSINVDTAFDIPAGATLNLTASQLIGTRTAGGTVNLQVAGEDATIGTPGSTTDNSLVRWDGTDGSAIQNSGVTLSDTDAMVFPSTGSISKPGTGANSQAFGAAVDASGANSVGVANYCLASGERSVSIGDQSSARVFGSVALGYSSGVFVPATGDNDGAIAIGYDASAGQTSSAGVGSSVVIGANANVGPGATDSIAIGPASSVSTNSDGISIGNAASCSGSRGVSIGYQTSVSNTRGIAVGQLTSVSGLEGIAIGNGATCSGAQGVSLGQSADCDAVKAVAIGWDAKVSDIGALDAICIGTSSRAFARDSLVLGRNATVHLPGTGSNNSSICIGSNAFIGAFSGAGCNSAIAIGESTSIAAGSLYAIALGTNAAVSEDYGIAIGYNASSQTYIGGIAFGTSSRIDGNYGVTTGYTSRAGQAAVAYGWNATASGTFGVALGGATVASQQSAIAIGYAAEVQEAYGISIGQDATIHDTTAGDSEQAIIVGYNSDIAPSGATGCDAAILIGSSATIDDGSLNAIGLGYAVAVKAAETIVVGNSATVHAVASGDSTGAIAIGQGVEIGNSTPGAGCNAAICIGEAARIDANCANTVCIGAGAIADAGCYGSVIIGQGADGNAFYRSVVVGQASDSTGNNATAVGWQAQAGTLGVALGYRANVTSTGFGIAIGRDTIVSNAGMAIGSQAESRSNGGLAIGESSLIPDTNTGSNDYAIAIGLRAQVGVSTEAGAEAAISIGKDSSVGSGAVNSIVVGQGATIYGVSSGDSAGAVAIGSDAQIGNATPGAGCNASICIGESTTVEPGAIDAICIGPGSTVGEGRTVLVGLNSRIRNTTAGDSFEAICIGYNSDIAPSAATGCDAAIAVGSNIDINDGALNAIAIGTAAKVSSGVGSISIGWGSDSDSDNQLVIGRAANGGSSSVGSVILGTGSIVRDPSTGDSDGSICIGYNAIIGGITAAGCDAAIAIGNGASVAAGGTNSLAIGPLASATGTYIVSIGSGAAATGGNVISIGRDSVANGSNCIAVGVGTSSFETGSVALGYNAKVHDITTGSSFGAIAIGNSATIASASGTAANHGIAIGQQASVADGCDNGLALGYLASVASGHTNSVAIGASATTTAANRVNFASTLEVQIGQGLGVWGTTPPASQPAKITDPTDLATALTAIASVIDVLEGAGLSSAT